jgi:hypothetical protein
MEISVMPSIHACLYKVNELYTPTGDTDVSYIYGFCDDNGWEAVYKY